MEENDYNNTESPVIVSISIPPEVFNISSEDSAEIGLVFTSYATPILFPLLNATFDNESQYVTDSVVLGFSVPGVEVKELNKNVTVTLQSFRAQNGLVS